MITQVQDLLYGNLPKPGTLGQFFVWETGTFVLLLTAIMMVLLAVRLTRVSENSGQLEMVWRQGSDGGWPWNKYVRTFLLCRLLLL